MDASELGYTYTVKLRTPINKRPPRIMAKVHKVKTGYWVFDCPGCGSLHSIQTPPWSFNGDLEKPTVSPSILVHGGESHPRCHSFVKDGMIQYLNDCDHELKGQTVEIPHWTSMKEVLNR